MLRASCISALCKTKFDCTMMLSEPTVTVFHGLPTHQCSNFHTTRDICTCVNSKDARTRLIPKLLFALDQHDAGLTGLFTQQMRTAHACRMPGDQNKVAHCQNKCLKLLHFGSPYSRVSKLSVNV